MRQNPVIDSINRTSRFESFEDRLALTADSLANATANLDDADHGLELHSGVQIEEAGPQLEMHDAVLDSPPLQLHQVVEVPMLEAHQVVELPSLELHSGEQAFLHNGVQEVELHDDQLNVGQEYNSAGDFHLEELTDIFLDAGDVDTALSSAHGTTGVDYVHSTYGLDGSGQTVAIIDSGIAYDHDNLGGGLGNRVVGGWDFAENDADFYDDGPAGFHGTHVAGIVGSDHAVHTGVAPGADLVGLRVFDDDGNGYFSHVESALQWVHDNRFSFEHDITTVNLSLGTSWNSDAIPSWAMLEDEFQQLHADGIFVSVSAGNSFSTFNEAGVSYPAASPFVVPVGSVTDQGVFSSFSQRNDRTLSAPGSSIASTVPGYLFGNSANTSAFGTASGTSMAAPYVAGASVLVREAMQMAGYTNITQDTIYDHLRDTADIFHDSATDANYHKINMQTALDELIGDDGNSTIATAEHIGTLDEILTVDSSILTENDVDFYTFTAANDGTVTMYTEDGEDVDVSADALNVTTTGNDNQLLFDVVGGQSYTIEVGSTQGAGTYTLGLQLTVDETLQPVDAADLGRIDFTTLENETVSDNWYQLAADHNAALTVEALYDHTAGVVEFDLYDADMNLIGSSNAAAPSSDRIDAAVTEGSTFYIHVTGDHTDVDFRITNLLADGPNDNMVVYGTDGDDTIILDARTLSVHINGVEYTADPTGELAGTITAIGGSGTDIILLHGSDEADTVTLQADQFSGTLGNAEISGTGFERITVDGHGGDDTVTFANTLGRDDFLATPTVSSMKGAGYRNTAQNVEVVNATSGGGADFAKFYDGAGTDHFGAGANESFMNGEGYSISATGFDRNFAYSTQGGNDTAVLLDSDGSDTFISRSSYTMLAGNGFFNKVHGFAQVTATSTQGQDSALFHDSQLNDTFQAGPDSASLSNSLYQATATGFSFVSATAFNGGNDTAILEDSTGNDLLTATPNSASMSGAGYLNVVTDFDQVLAYASEGNDQAYLMDGSGDDTFYSHPTVSWMTGEGYFNLADGFDSVEAFSSQGHDVAKQYDSLGNDRFVSDTDRTWMSGTGYFNRTHGFDQVEAYASQGNDIAKHYDGTGSDRFVADANRSWMIGDGYFNRAHGFDKDFAYSTRGGDDSATFKDSVNDDLFMSKQEFSLMVGNGFYNQANGFSEILALSTKGGSDSATILDSHLNDRFDAYSNYATMTNAEHSSTAVGFEFVTGVAANGGDDTARMYDTMEDDRFTANPTTSTLQGAGYSNTADNFELVMAFASGGNDTATFRDSDGDDTFGAKPGWSWMTDDGSYVNFAQGFDLTLAFATQGNDQVNFWGDEGNEEYHAKSDYGWMEGNDYANFARGFDDTSVDGMGGNDEAIFHDVDEDDSIYGRDDFITVGDGSMNRTVRNIDRVEARVADGAQATADIDAVDFLFDQFGTWI